MIIHPPFADGGRGYPAVRGLGLACQSAEPCGGVSELPVSAWSGAGPRCAQLVQPVHLQLRAWESRGGKRQRPGAAEPHTGTLLEGGSSGCGGRTHTGSICSTTSLGFWTFMFLFFGGCQDEDVPSGCKDAKGVGERSAAAVGPARGTGGKWAPFLPPPTVCTPPWYPCLSLQWASPCMVCWVGEGRGT